MGDATMDMLEAFSAAWNRHDLEAIMNLSSPDCEFWASAGPDVEGARTVGRDAVASAYRAIFDTFPDGQWTRGHITLINPTRALSEWTFVGTSRDGKRVEVLGVDILDLQDGKVRIKNSFRKNRLG